MYSMNARFRTHYEVLGITRNAKPHEVKRAYDRLCADMRAETVPPDSRRLVRVQTAYEVLSDPARRDAYDEELRRGPLPPEARRRAWIAGACAAIVALGAAAYFATRTRGPRPRTETELLSAVNPAVGRVHAVDVSGRTQPLGLAVAIGPERLAMLCEGLAPNMELVVRIGSRDVQASVLDATGKRGYCLVRAPNAGSWPLAVARRLPRVGDRVYATRVSASGEVSLLEGRVQRVERHGGGAVLEVSGPAAHEEAGGPLLDVWGRVLAIADGRGHDVTVDESDARYE